MIKITTDSTCDLPCHLLEQYDVSVIPLGIVKGDWLYQDGVNIHTEDIAAHVDAGGDITTTNAVNIADYEELFRTMTARYDAVIHLNLGMGFSSCYQNAKLAAEEVPEVYVVDSANLTVGHGMLVLAAAEAAAAGKTVSEILAMLENMVSRVETSFVLDRLDYMKKGGRCSSVTALGANLLKLHPCVEVIDGKMSVTKKYRGSMEKVLAEYVRDRLAGRTDIDTKRVFLVDTCRTPGLVDVARKALLADGRFEEIVESQAGCTIFCHCGPDTLGLVYLRKQ
jgi:DegV family protein with EDD domain